ncbi:hypothetical protein BDM02DRAFT_877045 [Thelephora ganbajun]|uniref:Uncharacterized protein n=1 Tax=Thelephora ganbajun TaxID=370292 RepID=A0ACB6Z528_THEGA|nr:hypothetical protein BDM02DRAFT_877045 [Thelephora ganbajun]
MLQSHSVRPSGPVCSQLIFHLRHCTFPPLLNTTTHGRLSKKQCCDVCKHPHSFTKVYVSNTQNNFPSCSYFASSSNSFSPSCCSASARFWPRAFGWPCYPGSPCRHGGNTLLWETLRACFRNLLFRRMTDDPTARSE